ncbi:FAD:protein FMN transferase [Gordonia sp. L191]|uniref:FAD:protein FMN transferase n=1 Tax=Gordonia sp. L191 TaxID=2982699 RepID=UPI0024BF9EF8|nr:FAD:protein FMN transferase [Gordonia sp. L191]WHU47495.1 FAD:protein FMN transferase [Gordonia sp. L191]
MTTTTAAGPAVYATSLRAIGTDVRVVVTEPAALPQARELLVVALAELDLAASRFRPDSELSRTNRLAATAAGGGREQLTVTVSPELAELLTVALRVENLTDGLVTPATGAALVAAGYDADLDVVRRREPTTEPGRPQPIPTPRIGLTGCRVTLPAGTMLDLGSSAKAHAAQRCANRIAECVGGGVLVDLGGDIGCAGTPPRDGWRIGVRDWTGRTRQTVCVHDNQAFATSSTRVRTWRRGRTIVHHIIDPRTGTPARTPWAQVTCMAADTVLANAASTAAVIVADDAPEWLTRRRIPALLVDHDGHGYRVAGWPPETSTGEAI